MLEPQRLELQPAPMRQVCPRKYPDTCRTHVEQLRPYGDLFTQWRFFATAVGAFLPVCDRAQPMLSAQQVLTDIWASVACAVVKSENATDLHVCGLNGRPDAARRERQSVCSVETPT